MSHELRTPLNAIIGFAQMLNGLGGPIGERQQKEYSQYIMDSGDRLLKVINQVLDLSSIEAGSSVMLIEDVELPPLVHKVANEVSILAHKRNIALIDDVSAVVLPRVRADTERLTQALVNLAANSVKYNRENGEVRIFAVELPRVLRLCVSDTGPGIAPDRHDEVFETFNRIGAERSSLEGSGVGLSLAKEYVEKMGGSIGFESELGAGSTFWLELPLADDLAEPVTEIDWRAGRRAIASGTRAVKAAAAS